MHGTTWSATMFTLLATVGASVAIGASEGPAATDELLQELGGEWIYVEDQTKDRAVEDQGPPMSPRLRLRVDEDALVWERAGGREDRMQLEGQVETPDGDAIRRTKGSYRDGLYEYEIQTERADGSIAFTMHKAFEITPDGMLVHVAIDPPDGYSSVALYRHPEDIEPAEPAKARIDDMAWLAGAWSKATTKSTTEERWSPPDGGAMLGTSRTVRDGRMVAFEYLRIVERDGGLVYVAQPGGNPPTEFVLTEMEGKRAVFDNPRHDSPQRIVYELSDAGGLTAWIGFINGGKGTRFEFQRDGD